MMIRCTFHRELYDMVNFMMNDSTLFIEKHDGIVTMQTKWEATVKNGTLEIKC